MKVFFPIFCHRKCKGTMSAFFFLFFIGIFINWMVNNNLLYKMIINMIFYLFICLFHWIFRSCIIFHYIKNSFNILLLCELKQCLSMESKLVPAKCLVFNEDFYLFIIAIFIKNKDFMKVLNWFIVVILIEKEDFKLIYCFNGY